MYWRTGIVTKNETQSQAARRVLYELINAENGSSQNWHISFTPQPRVVTPAGWYCSLSHSSHIVAAAIAQQPIGIDIEVVKERSPLLLEKISTEEERAIVLDQYPNLTRDQLLTALWVIKEASSKVEGVREPASHLVIEQCLANTHFKIKGRIHFYQVNVIINKDFVAALSSLF